MDCVQFEDYEEQTDSVFIFFALDGLELVADVISLIKQTLVDMEHWAPQLADELKNYNLDITDVVQTLANTLYNGFEYTTVRNIFQKLLEKNNIDITKPFVQNACTRDWYESNILFTIIEEVYDDVELGKALVCMVADVAGDKIQEMVLYTEMYHCSLLHEIVYTRMPFEAKMYINLFLKLAGNKSDILLKTLRYGSETALDIVLRYKYDDLAKLLLEKMNEQKLSH